MYVAHGEDDGAGAQTRRWSRSWRGDRTGKGDHTGRRSCGDLATIDDVATGASTGRQTVDDPLLLLLHYTTRKK